MIELVAISLLTLAPFSPGESTQKVGLEDGGFQFDVNGAPIVTYRPNDPGIPRPHFKQVFASNGNRVTRRYPTDPVINKDNDDHATYHPGIWLAFGDINGADFWRNKARVEQSELRIVVDREKVGGSRISAQNAYMADDTLICNATFWFYPSPSDYGIRMTVRSEFENPDAAFAFGDQEEMGLGIRMATALTVKYGSGTILNSEGGVDEAGTWGKQADWCAYEGVVDGKRTGVMIVPHWDNFRKSWFHTRDYGLMVANPFGRKAMTGPNDDNVLPDQTRVEAGEAFVIGFDILLYGSDRDEPFDHDAAYREILGKQKKEFAP